MCALNFNHLPPSDVLLLKSQKLISSWPVTLATQAEEVARTEKKNPAKTALAEVAAIKPSHPDVPFCAPAIKVREPFRTFAEAHHPRSGLKLPSRNVYCEDGRGGRGGGGDTQKFFTRHA